MDHLKKKLKRSNYYLHYLSLNYKSGNIVTQSRYARGPQLRVHVINVISELYFIASGSVLSRVISSIWFICVHKYISVSFHFLLILFPFNLFSLDHDSAEEASENFARPFENNRGSREESWGERCVHCKTTRFGR
jgi:hypothetical protein